MKNGRLIAVFAAIIVVCAAVTVILFTHRSDSCRAGVYLDGRLVEVIDLSRTRDGCTLEVEGPIGVTVLTVENGEIFVSRADCPDQICVNHGPLGSGPPIVCLPNRLTVRWLEDEVADAYTGI